MPASDHPSFEPPSNPDIKIWRYMDFTKFVSMLENQGLFFSRADKLGDPFEGTYRKAEFETWMKNSATLGVPAGATSAHRKMMQAVRKWTVVNCWHMNDHESAAMWKLYAATNEAIAVCSTYRKLHASLDIMCSVGVVRYIDYDNDEVGSGNALAPYVCKRRSFSHENEVRAVILGTPRERGDGMGLDLDAERHDGGMWKSINLAEFIDEVRLAPTSPSWFHKLVEQVVRRYSHKFPVKQSSLDDAPFM